MNEIFKEYVHLVRLALEGKHQDASMLAKRNLRLFTNSYPELADTLKNLLLNYEQKAKITRENLPNPLPIDTDSKLELLQKELVFMEKSPVWPEAVSLHLNAIIEERKYQDELISKGLAPTKSVLFVGAPGVGKTLAARWLSFELKRPLLTIDLAALMSSYLGKTGNNIRAALNYAQKNPSILLLDEFDAIAKRRNDDSEVGELKRLVNVLLQAIDDWPDNGLMVAATNHPELLDPAVWRRFERIVEFPNPSQIEIKTAINNLLSAENPLGLEDIIDILSKILEGASFAEVTRLINLARRESIVKAKELRIVLEDLIKQYISDFDRPQKMEIALKLLSGGYSQRRVAEITGTSRDTLRRYTKQNI
ncbi:AAA family ATPase [Brevibacillus brevis]|uniref:AAA family ATPase n=1 Tax=Brevibacillus brevis TaxID=1393 RepID=UPI001EE21A32|nr:ATP-binding protein [Brevibacillus brevis]